MNDATQFMGKPLVYGSIYQFEGQATVFMPGQETPCYRCLFPSPPPPGTVPSCAEGGVFGVLPGVIGAIQATEAIKLITGEGETARWPAAAVRRPAHGVPGSEDPLGRRLPGVRQGAHHHRADRLRAVLRRPRPLSRPRGDRPTMAVTVKLPTILRKHAGRRGEGRRRRRHAPRRARPTSRATYPGITKNVIADDGGLHRFINVYVNDEDVRYLGSLETEVTDGDTVSILPAVAGGC